MKNIIKKLLKLSLFLSVAAATNEASPIVGSIKTFFSWPIDNLSEPTPTSNGPLLSQKLVRTLYDSSPIERNENALFSFTLTGSAARKHSDRVRELNGYGVNYYDGPNPGDLVDIHGMVVHVTYEDICKLACYYDDASREQSSYWFNNTSFSLLNQTFYRRDPSVPHRCHGHGNSHVQTRNACFSWGNRHRLSIGPAIG